MSLVYFALWVIFNGRVTLEIVVAGVILSLLLDLFVKRCLKIRLTGATFWKAVKLLPDVIFYGIVLLVEIVRANFTIIRLVLAPSIQVSPCLVKFRTPLRTNAARIALANSITLTPGTITVSMENDELLVHALDREIADGLKGSIFERLLARMERRANA